MLALSRVGLSLNKSASGLALARPTLGLARPMVRGLRTTQPPGGIIGTVNDAYVAPPPSKMHGSYHWTAERLVSVGLVPLVVAPFLTGTSTLLDSSLAGLLLYHCYVGFQSCVIDYIPDRVYGIYHKVALWLLTLGTGVAGYGLYEIESKEGGLAPLVAKIWRA